MNDFVKQIKSEGILYWVGTKTISFRFPKNNKLS